MNGLMYKTDDSNTDKCRFKPVQSNFKPKLKDKLVQCYPALAWSFALNDLPCDYWAKNLTYWQCFTHKALANWLLALSNQFYKLSVLSLVLCNKTH